MLVQKKKKKKKNTCRIKKFWPSGLRHCSKNWKASGSNPTRFSAGPRDLTLS